MTRPAASTSSASTWNRAAIRTSSFLRMRFGWLKIEDVPELRKDPITGRWVIISTDRSKRPSDFLRESAALKGTSFCPFCPGNESKTPPEILPYRPGHGVRDSDGWSLRVLRNKLPVLGM